MITINLLPGTSRKREKPPRLWQALSGVLLAATLAGAAGVARYGLGVVPGLEARLAGLGEERQSLARADAELSAVETRLGNLAGNVDMAKNLYSRRIVWSKVLQDVKEIVAGKGVRLTRVAGYGNLLTLEGNSPAPPGETALRVERLVREIRVRRPASGTGLAGTPIGNLLEDGWPVVRRVEANSEGGSDFSVELQFIVQPNSGDPVS